MTVVPVANPVMRAGLEGIVSLIQLRITRELGLIRQPEQAFWRPVTRALELCCREQAEARLERQESAGRSEEALAEFVARIAETVEEMLIPSDKRVRLQAITYEVARAGLAGLVPALVCHIEIVHKED